MSRYRYDDRRRPAPQRSRSSGGTRRRRSRYRLKYPGRLIVFLLLIVVVIVIAVSCGKKNRTAEEESSTPIEIISGKKEVETGTIRSVQTVTLEGMSTQLTTYMASMIYANPTNYKRTSSKPNEEAPDQDVDLSQYRYVVAINPTAGGANNGWMVDDAIEKNITLSVARYLVDYLNSNSTGYYFLLVRNADTTMTDNARLARINNYEADLVITLGCNGSDLELGGVIATSYQQPTEYDEDGDPKPKSERDRITEELAQKLMEECADGLKMWYRETQIEEDNPLLTMEVPAVKVYMGFLTYEHDNYLVLDEVNQVAAAEKMGKVILDFCDAHAPSKTRGQIAGEALMNGGSNSESSGSTESSKPQESSYVAPAYSPATQDSTPDDEYDEDTDYDEDEWYDDEETED